mgnify:FL=1
MIPVLTGLSALALALSPLAIDDAPSSKLSLSCNDATQGGYMTLQLEATGLNKISAFSCSIYYPSDCLDFSSQSIDSSISLYNCKETAKGQVAFSFLSADKDGVSFADNTVLLSLSFYVHNDAPVDSIRFTCATGDVYDSSKNSIALNSPYCVVNINAVQEETTPNTFKIDIGNGSNATYNVGDVVPISVGTLMDPPVSILTFRLVMSYDYSYFDFVSFEYEEAFLDGQNNVNSKQSGVVSWAFIAANGVSVGWGQIGTLKLKVRVNKNVSTPVRATVSQVRDVNKTPLNGSEHESEGVKIAETTIVPKMKVCNLRIEKDVMSVDCIIDEGSQMACGDFTIEYPKDYLFLINATTSIPNKVFLSKDKGVGQYNFSYLDSANLQSDATLLTLTFERKKYAQDIFDQEIRVRNRYYTEDPPRNAGREPLVFSYVSCPFSWPFLFESLSFEASWNNDREVIYHNGGEGIYLNAGDYIGKFRVNDRAIDEAAIYSDASSIIKRGDLYTATVPMVIRPGVDTYGGSIFIALEFNDEYISTAYTRRANQYVHKLGLMTIGKTICNEDGFLPETKDALSSLLKEYDTFPQSLQNQLSV